MIIVCLGDVYFRTITQKIEAVTRCRKYLPFSFRACYDFGSKRSKVRISRIKNHIRE